MEVQIPRQAEQTQNGAAETRIGWPARKHAVPRDEGENRIAGEREAADIASHCEDREYRSQGGECPEPSRLAPCRGEKHEGERDCAKQSQVLGCESAREKQHSCLN